MLTCERCYSTSFAQHTAGFPLATLGRVATVLNFLHLVTFSFTMHRWIARPLEILLRSVPDSCKFTIFKCRYSASSCVGHVENIKFKTVVYLKRAGPPISSHWSHSWPHWVLGGSCAQGLKYRYFFRHVRVLTWWIQYKQKIACVLIVSVY